MPRGGEVVYITAAASVQFVAVEPFLFRVIRTWVAASTPTGWAWMTGYQLNATGNATVRRDLFVQPAGLRPVTDAPSVLRPTNRGPAAIPAQRNRSSSSTPARSHR